MNKSQATLFGRWLAQQQMGSAIDTTQNASLGSLELCSELGRRLCASAHRRYLTQVSLFFVPIDYTNNSNAFACWPGSFDVVAVTARLLREIEQLSSRAASYIFAVEQRGDITRSSFSPLFRQVGNKVEQAHVDALAGLLTQGMMSFLVGHEVGHLVAGHRGTYEKYQWSKGAVGAGCIIEAASHALSGQSPDDERKAKILNAHEVDADVFGLQFLCAHWDHVLMKLDEGKNDSLNQDVAGIVFLSLLKNSEDRLFLSMFVVAMALALLGFQNYESGKLVRPTHPLTSVRLLAAIKVLPTIAGIQDPNRTIAIKEQGTEAIVLICSVLGSMLLDALRVDTRLKVALALKEVAPADRLTFMLEQTSLDQAMRESETFGEYFRQLAVVFSDTEFLRKPHLRWEAQHLPSWTGGNESAQV